MNQVHLMGNLTRDVETRNTTNGHTVANFTVAVNGPFSRGDNQDVAFIDCEAWNKTADIILQYFRKGDRIIVHGALKQDTWEKDGQKRSKLKLVVNSFDFAGGRKRDEDESEREPEPKAKKSRRQPEASEEYAEGFPF